MNKLTQKRENFANNLFKGMTQREAWIEAGYSSNYAVEVIDTNACNLAKQNKIQLRLEELRQAVKTPLIADRRERQEILTEIVRGRLTDYTTCGPDRDLINVGSESPNTAALQEVISRTEYDKDGSGVAVVTRIKLHDPVRAVDVLNKMDGIYNDTAPPQTQVINSFTFILPDGTRVTPKQLKEVSSEYEGD